LSAIGPIGLGDLLQCRTHEVLSAEAIKGSSSLKLVLPSIGPRFVTARAPPHWPGGVSQCCSGQTEPRKSHHPMLGSGAAGHDCLCNHGDPAEQGFTSTFLSGIRLCISLILGMIAKL
jgi:hypothetical protein